MAAKILSISLPQDLNDEVVAIANEERRTISEIFREVIRQYAANRAVADVRKAIKRTKKNIERKILKKSLIREENETSCQSVRGY
ncbi:MAG: hypothetical protein A2504_01075 [Bdellovibrionales bacterium RIFOXYD12_FULL_39_22]|nr:MAG: hypothetical protein A2385_01965 [Bdellovibrionales bacterium RIFOXYB1_FULL_39_21]OFZ42699.1 MAG: hypothetical protein A2485_10150 [Bdellovibrionales bacterium RIFOXYC12_FULL_39_17]OFZ47258.1 MAG: hypothetical protein A2404_14755 [Bdellovibrionales bacterium RIFOXYC1_FULL_39_130]OFZ75424.1 MAG: hypothetical protein A2560_04025 [Bdellovibrionales bacterium RIFOXYD1_FULL_39_84]OFZ93378.1 MAG: hypothetical protein A2504_01075 [Bdellovibrionales bacterium RIFOXYD12_FULL_39_22]HLE12349.1 ri